MSNSKGFQIFCWANIVIGFVLGGLATKELFLKDWWFIGHFLGAMFFFAWAKGLEDLRKKAVIKEALKPKSEKPSTPLSDQFGSFRDLGMR